MTNQSGYLLRENTGTTGLELTARTAIGILAHYDIPHLIVGGLALQEHGYSRLTTDVDLVVPDVIEAVEMLTADLSGPFKKMGEVADRVEDTRNHVLIDLHPAGRVLKRGCQVPFPDPIKVSVMPTFVSIEDLISLKLDSWRNTPVLRLRDKADVVQLIACRNLPRDLKVHPSVSSEYIELWDALSREQN